MASHRKVYSLNPLEARSFCGSGKKQKESMAKEKGSLLSLPRYINPAYLC
jgi:hypothetical protein